MIASIGLPAIGVLGGIMQAIEQLRHVKLTSTTVAVEGGEQRSDFKLEFAALAEDDPLTADVRLGLCPLPLFRFREEELERIASTPSTEDVRELLEKHGVMPYFFPAPDQLALGLIDREQPSVEALLPQIRTAPAVGHPLGANEILPPDVKLGDLVEALRAIGLHVEGEEEVTLTEKGIEVRSAVRFEPREGIVSKVLNRVSISVNPADWFR